MNISSSHTLVSRRIALVTVAGLTLPAARAAGYPERPLRWIVPSAAGGPTDVVARLVSETIGAALNGQRPVVDNRPGGSSIVGTQLLFSSASDGYTIGSVNDNLAINELLLSKIPYRYTDFEFICGLTKMPIVLAVRSESHVKNLADMVGYLKANNGKLNYSSWGAGSGAHLAGERLCDRAGVSLVHVPFAGSAPATHALLAGQTDFVVMDVATVLPFHGSKLRIVATMTKERIPTLPDVAAVSELIPGFDAIAWNGVVAPRGTSNEKVQFLAKAMQDALKEPAVKKNLEERGMTIWGSTPQELRERLMADYREAKAIVEKRQIKLG